MIILPLKTVSFYPLYHALFLCTQFTLTIVVPYNKFEGKGFTFNATSYMQYGKFSAQIKSANVPGAVTAVILIADNGDEIDFELLTGGTNTIT